MKLNDNFSAVRANVLMMSPLLMWHRLIGLLLKKKLTRTFHNKLLKLILWNLLQTKGNLLIQDLRIHRATGFNLITVFKSFKTIMLLLRSQEKLEIPIIVLIVKWVVIALKGASEFMDFLLVFKVIKRNELLRFLRIMLHLVLLLIRSKNLNLSLLFLMNSMISWLHCCLTRDPLIQILVRIMMLLLLDMLY